MKLTDSKSYNIQILRGLSIIAVVFIHNTPVGLAQIWCRPFLNFSVGLFLFLSGMLSNVYRWNPQKRILKVAIPYIIWTLIYVVIGNIKTLSSIPVSYLNDLLTGRSAAIMYYIFVYCEFTLLTPLIDKLARSKYKYFGFAIAPIEIICMRLIPLIVGYEINKYVSIVMGISCLGWFAYYYLGYLLGNNMIELNLSIFKISFLFVSAIVLQILEGYWYLLMGETNCGTQLKLTSILAGVLFAILSFRFVNSGKNPNIKILYLLGNNSFGIYFSHLAVMSILIHIPYYTKFVIYPFNAIIAIIVSLACVFIGKKLLGKYSKYLAL